MDQRKRANLSDRNVRSLFLKASESRKRDTGFTPDIYYKKDPKNESRQSPAILLATPSTNTEALLRHAFMSCGYKIRTGIADISISRIPGDISRVMVIVLDYEILRGDYPAELPNWLEKVSRNLRILVIGPRIVDCAKRTLLEAGVHGYLALPENLHLLLKAIKEIASGGLWFERSTLNAAIFGVNFLKNSSPKASPSRTLEDLTRQERNVADYVGQGLSNGEIAAKLNISIKTVKQHLTRIYKKLDVSNRVQLTLLLRKDQPASDFLIAALRNLSSLSKENVTELLPDRP